MRRRPRNRQRSCPAKRESAGTFRRGVGERKGTHRIGQGRGSLATARCGAGRSEEIWLSHIRIPGPAGARRSGDEVGKSNCRTGPASRPRQGRNQNRLHSYCAQSREGRGVDVGQEVCSCRARSLLDYVATFSAQITFRSSMTNPKFSLLAELTAEFLGTFVLIMLGTGVVAMVVLFPTTTPGEVIHGGFTNITLGWGLGVTMGIYVAGKISGAHLNPAVTLALAIFRGFPWKKVLPYSIAQVAGAFVAAALVYRNYLPAFHQVDPQSGENGGGLHHIPGVSQPAASGISGPGDRHCIAAAVHLRHHG